jgi:hypothetical protein
MRRSEYLTPAKLREIAARYPDDNDLALVLTEIRVLRLRVSELTALFGPALEQPIPDDRPG